MNKIISSVILFLTIIYCGYSQNNDTIIDIDGNFYTTVTIMDQTWMKENLKTTHYNDSTPVPYVTGKSKWVSLKTDAYTFYENDKNNKKIYGVLYNWYAVETNKLCPAGWHVATDDDWNLLEINLGMDPSESDLISYRSTSKGGKLKDTGTVQDSTGLWHTPNEGGTNNYNFSALPGGFVYYNDGFSYGVGSYGFWWSSTSVDIDHAWYRLLYYHSGFMSRNKYNKGYGFSVRCVKD